MASIILRFVNENDEVDAQIRRGQYGFWATHVEALDPYQGQALRYNDDDEQFEWTRAGDKWQEQCIVKLDVRAEQSECFYDFLECEVVGKRYDMRAMAKVKYDLTTHDRSRWNCSDPIYLALVSADVLRCFCPGLWFMTARDIMIALSAIIDLPAIETRDE